jgi:putative SOS response-associated peptidase YedK
MSTHYETLQNTALYADAFNVEPLSADEARDMWPRKPGVFIRKLAVEAAAEPVAVVLDSPPQTDEAPAEIDAAPVVPSAAPAVLRELVAGQWGFVPPWVKSASDAKLRSTKLVNARSEIVSTSNNFRDAWLGGRRCIVPMMAFYEDDWRSGKAVPTRISRIDGKPMGVAGLWESWTGATGETITSFTLLTVNANSHALMHRYQQPGSEKRMVAVLNEGAYDAWLSVRFEKAREFMRAYPANWLAANPVETKASKVPQF